MDELHLYTDDELSHILSQYKKHRKRVKEYYEKIKDTDHWKQMNNANAKKHYEKNRHIVRERYYKDAEYNRAKSSYYYYRRMGRQKEFVVKFPGRMEMLIERDFFKGENPFDFVEDQANDQNPSLSIITSDISSSSEVADPSSSE